MSRSNFCSCCLWTVQNTVKAKEQLKILKSILGAFMLRRTKSKLIESGTLVLPSLTEITVYVKFWMSNFGKSYSNSCFIFWQAMTRIAKLSHWILKYLTVWHPLLAYKKRSTCQFWGRSFLNYLPYLLGLQIISLCRI